MALSTRDIASLVEEIAPAIVQGWIQKIHQPTPRVLTFEIRTHGRTQRLLLSADLDTARLHLLTRRYPNPASPPPFCQFLRAHIQGARIDALEQMAGDRIVRLGLTARDGPCSVVAELMGRRANVMLLSASGTIVASLDTDRARVGAVYQPPEFRPAPECAPESDRIDTDAGRPFPVSLAVEQRFHHLELERAEGRARQARLAVLRSAIKKTRRRIDALRSDLEKAARYQDYARYGELLKANLHRMKKGFDRVTVIDYFDPAMPELVLPLDPAKGPQGNMEDYFKKYRKYISAHEEIRPRLTVAEAALATHQLERTRLEQGLWKPEPPALPERPSSPREREPVQKQERRSGPFRRFVSTDGVPIYVGRNALENDRLTFGEARPDDLWFHARSAPGSHVVVRLERGADAPTETLRDAANLALLYSDLKKSGKGEVIYTRRKYVRKLKGKPPGTVAVSHEHALFVSLDRPRLAQLKARSTPSP